MQRAWQRAASCLLLVLGTIGVAGAAPAGGDACFEQTFQKRTAAGNWLVRECSDEKGLRYRVAFGTGKNAGQAGIDVPDPEGVVDVNYQVLEDETLLIDAYAERGGRAYLVHPIKGSATLSVVAFRYMSDDEESLAVRQDGRRIRASTRHGTQVFVIDAEGRLTKTGGKR